MDLYGLVKVYDYLYKIVLYSTSFEESLSVFDKARIELFSFIALTESIVIKVLIFVGSRKNS
jgi:hypothetical protein